MADEIPVRAHRPAIWVWRGGLAFFVLAGLTGAFFRFATAGGFSLGLSLGNVRHAHSHTMYFGWVTPSLMALMAYRLAKLSGRDVMRVGPVIVLAFTTALLAYVPFLLFGYTPAIIGNTKLPLSMMGAGLNVLAWYWFVVLYLRYRGNDSPSVAVRLFDLAVFFLVLATLGAWGLSMSRVLGIDGLAIRTALTHVFLDIFSEGWFVLGVLGLAASEAHLESRAAAWGVRVAPIGIPITFALGMPPSLVPPLFKWLSSLGGMLVAIGLPLIAIPLWRQLNNLRSPGTRRMWRFALAALVVKALAEGAVSIVPDANWAGMPQLRIIYLHVVLLGFVSVGLVAAARSAWGDRATRTRTAFVLAVTVLLVFLAPFIPIWPVEWRGVWLLWLIAFAALGPVASAVWMLVSSRKADAGY